MPRSLLSLPPPVPSGSTLIRCRLCDQTHTAVRLEPGERALCVACGSLLLQRSRWGRDAALAFTLAGLAFAVPAVVLPIVTVEKFNNTHAVVLLSGADALWMDGMRVLATWVLLCGTLAPLLLLVTLAGLLLPPKFGRPIARDDLLWRFAHSLQHWAMPEVYVLAILVALTKLGTLVNVTVGPGLWCYAAMTLLSVAAWSSFAYSWPGAPRELRAALVARS